MKTYSSIEDVNVDLDISYNHSKIYLLMSQEDIIEDFILCFNTTDSELHLPILQLSKQQLHTIDFQQECINLC